MNDRSSVTAATMINVAADRIGEMLVEMAEGDAEYGYEELARQALVAGLNTLIEEGPGEARVDAVGRAIHRRLHDENGNNWGDLPEVEKSFWTDIACQALAAADVDLIRELQEAG